MPPKRFLPRFFNGDYRNIAHEAAMAKGRLDFSDFNSKTPYLYLLVDSSKVIELAAGKPPDQIADRYMR